jgi:aerobic-type carbon monoxide dehydrogenase small subunit (CoxS/CutS family)
VSACITPIFTTLGEQITTIGAIGADSVGQRVPP